MDARVMDEVIAGIKDMKRELHDHTVEARTSATAVQTKVDHLSEQMAVVSGKVDNVRETVAGHKKAIDILESQNTDQYRKLNSGQRGFWSTTNAKYVIFLGIVVVVAITALAGERITLENLLP